MLSDFVSSTLPLIGIIGISDAVALYAAYLALSVWRGLAVPIYRSRALWTALVAILFSLTIIFSGNVDTIFPEAYRYVASLLIYYLLYTVTLVVLYIWIDRTISTLVRLDFLRRDLLGWRKFRFVYWSFALVSLVLDTFISSPSISIIGVLFLVTNLVPFAYASIALVVGSAKTLDLTFRSHARWAGYCMFGILLSALTYFATPYVALQDLPIFLISYSLYKMAKFLVPVGTLPATQNST